MRCANTIDDYLRDPRDAYVVGREFAAFHVAPTLFGLVVWGRPDIEQARQIVAARGAELADGGPHHVVLDYRLLEVVDQEAFRVIAEWVAANRDALTANTARVALVKPIDPFAGATVAGFYTVVKAPYPSQLCLTLDDAEAWLGVPVVEPATRVHDLSAAGRSTITTLVQLLDRSPAMAVDEAARSLGLSGRTLQRRLRAEGTTYVAESRKAIIRRAKHLLATTDDKIADIAHAVGCASPQHFTDLFRSDVGVPPAAWRQTVRTKS
jgi:AraC-like DNA-binding protein